MTEPLILGGRKIRSTTRAAFMVVVSCGAITSAALAQGAGAELTTPGTLTARPDAQLGGAASTAARRAAFLGAQKILDIVRRDDALAHSIGYATSVRRVAGITRASGTDNTPIGLPSHFGVTGTIVYFSTEDLGNGRRGIEPMGRRVPFSVLVNGIGRVENSEELAIPLDLGPPVISGYRITGQFHGHPIYDGDCAYVSKGPASLVPLTKDRYLKLVVLGMRADSIRNSAQFRESGVASAPDAYTQWKRDKPKRDADFRATYEQLKKVSPAAAETLRVEMQRQEAAITADSMTLRGQNNMIAQLQQSATDSTGAMIRRTQAELDALSAAERRQPVSVIQHGVDWDWHSDNLADSTDDGAKPLMQLNLAAFDRTAAADTPQSIWVCVPGLQGIVDHYYENLAGDSREEERRAAERRSHDAALIRDHLDWAALEALVARP